MGNRKKNKNNPENVFSECQIKVLGKLLLLNFLCQFQCNWAVQNDVIFMKIYGFNFIGRKNNAFLKNLKLVAKIPSRAHGQYIPWFFT